MIQPKEAFVWFAVGGVAAALGGWFGSGLVAVLLVALWMEGERCRF